MEHMLKAAETGLITLVEYRNTLTMLTGVRLDASAAEVEELRDALMHEDEGGEGTAAAPSKKRKASGSGGSPQKRARK